MDRRRVAMLVALLGVLAAFAWLRVTFSVDVDPPVVASGSIGQDTVTLPSGPWVVRCPGPLGAGTPSWYFDRDGNTVFLPIGATSVPSSDRGAACARGEGGRWAGAASILALAVGVAVAVGAAQRVDVRRRELERNPLVRGSAGPRTSAHHTPTEPGADASRTPPHG